MGDNFIGEIRIFPTNWPPTGWHLCDGSTLTIQQYQALYSLLGTRYGGNGTTTFNLPDLRGRSLVGVTNLAANAVYSGTETVGLTQVPLHAHTVAVVSQVGTVGIVGSPAGSFNTFIAGDNSPLMEYAPVGTPTVNLATGTSSKIPTIASTGGGQAHNNMQPFLVLNYCIALTGVYPSRS